MRFPGALKLYRCSRLEPLHIPLLYYTVHKNSLTGRFGPWAEQRKILNVLLQEGYINSDEHNLRMAKLDLHQAYEEFILKGNYSEFWIYALKGIGAILQR